MMKVFPRFESLSEVLDKKVVADIQYVRLFYLLSLPKNSPLSMQCDGSGGWMARLKKR